MNDLGEAYTLAAVRFVRLLPGPIERLWEHLTVPSKLKEWYGKTSSIEPHEGGAVRLMNGHIRGVVTQWKPHSKLAHSWNVFSANEETSSYPESYLTLELAPAGDKVTLGLTHFPIVERFEKQNAMGWHTFIDIVEASLRGGGIESRMSYMEKNAARYGVDLSNLAR